MKKVIVAILAFFYLGISSGATIHLYYCMDKLVSWSLKAPASDRCSQCGMKQKPMAEKKDCCKHQQKQLKLDKDQKVTENSINLVQLSSITTGAHNFQYCIEALPSLTQKFPVSHAPPIDAGVDRNILHCTFRI